MIPLRQSQRRSLADRLSSLLLKFTSQLLLFVWAFLVLYREFWLLFTANPLPISFDQFKKNPVAGVAFLALVGISYLYYDVKSSYTAQLEESNKKIEALDVKIDKLGYALKKSDSALAAAITELRIINTMKKL